jgi:hypothetical protein
MLKYRIVIDLSDFKLYLLDENRVVRGFPAGIGKMVTTWWSIWCVLVGSKSTSLWYPR